MDKYYRTKTEINLSAIGSNYAKMRGVFAGKKIMSVLKADAYGHGISGIAKFCDDYTDQFAVATVDEGLRIRRAGAGKPVLLFGPVPEERMCEAARNQLTFSIGSLEYARRLAEKLGENDLEAPCHLKIETGMNRTGIRWRTDSRDAAMEQIRSIYSLRELRITGIYTHFSCSDSHDAEDLAYTAEQYRRFDDACRTISSEGYEIGIRHCCSTGGALLHPDYTLDMVRVGMMVYGQCDTLENMRKYGLRAALRWTSTISHIEELDAGEDVSYGRTFRIKERTRIGVVSCGYADGYRRNYQNHTELLVCGKRVPIAGRICMDSVMIDLTDVPQAQLGSEVVLLGSQGTEEITAIEIAAKTESTCGEVTAAISARVPRIYIQDWS